MATLTSLHLFELHNFQENCFTYNLAMQPMKGSLDTPVGARRVSYGETDCMPITACDCAMMHAL